MLRSGTKSLACARLFRRSTHTSTDAPASILVAGAGAVGLLIASKLQQSGIPASIISRRDNMGYVRRGQGDASMLDVTFSPLKASEALHISLPLVHLGKMIRDPGPVTVILCTKAYDCVKFLDHLSAQVNLTADSTVLVLNNGCLKVLDELQNNSNIKSIQAVLLVGSLSHGVKMSGEATVQHTGDGEVFFGPIVDSSVCVERGQKLAEMLNTAGMNASFVSKERILARLWQKLIVNSAINPVTALLGEPNRCITDVTVQQSFVHPIVDEACRVLLASDSHIAKSMMGGNVDLDVLRQHMLALVLDVASKTSANRSSMLVDVEQGRRTEIEYINGYLLTKGEEVGMGGDGEWAMPANAMVTKHIRRFDKDTMDGFRHGRASN